MLKGKKKVIQANSFLVKKKNSLQTHSELKDIWTFIQKYKMEIIIGNPRALEALGGIFDHLLAEHMIPVWRFVWDMETSVFHQSHRGWLSEEGVILFILVGFFPTML